MGMVILGKCLVIMLALTIVTCIYYIEHEK